MTSPAVERLLPEIYRSSIAPGGPLEGILRAMEALLEPAVAVVDGIDAFFDVYRAPCEFISFLAGWVDVRHLLSQDGSLPTGCGRLRSLVADAHTIAKSRGAEEGLLRLLTAATGVAGIRLNEHPGEYHLEVLVPPDAEALVPFIRRLVETEKPAHLTAEVVQAEGGPGG